MASKGEKKKAAAAKKLRKQGIRPQEFTYAKYIRHKDPESAYNDSESDAWTYTASMAIERTPRLRQFDPSWYIEWAQFQDELDLKRKKVVPLDWVQTPKAVQEEAAKTFHPNPRCTDEDLSDDRRSLHRALDTPTFLLVKTKSGGWGFPEGKWKTTETIRETAEKNTLDLCGIDLDTHLLGNAPVAHEEDSEKKHKWFLMHNIYVGGQCELDESKIEDFAWVTKYEFPDYFKDPKRLELLEKVFYCP